MSAFACLFVADLPVAAALRAEPELRGLPLAIIDSSRGAHEVAIVAGLLRGLTVAQALTVQSDLVVRPLSLQGMGSTQEALLDVGASVTPRVEDAEPGVVYLDLDGTEALFPSRLGLTTALETRLAEVGLDSAGIGVAPTRTAALLAARHGVCIIAAHEVERFLAPLPVDLLDPSEELADRLTRWGVQTLGELRRIPRRSLGARLGEEGVRLARRACGEDLTPFKPCLPPLRFDEGIEPDCAVTNLETLSFLLRGLLDRLVRRVRLRGLAIGELWLELVLESGAAFARTVGMRAPTTEVSVLTSLARLALENDHPREPVVRVRVVATPGSVEELQLDLFLPPLPAPAELALTAARLEALCGPGRVGTPGVDDTHRPDAAGLSGLPRGEAPLPGRRATACAPSGAQKNSHPVTAIRAIRPPRAVRVWGREGAPERVEALDADGPIGFVVQCAGPWRFFGEWWGEGRFARDYFDVELSDGGIYRIYRNLEAESWFADGVYD